MISLEESLEWIDEIAKRLSLGFERDQEAADLLSQAIADRAISLKRVDEIVTGKPVAVVGAGPTAYEDVLRASEALRRFVVFVADGAAGAFIEATGRAPDFVVSDLDGDEGALLRANSMGSTFFVHAHGDNMDAIVRLAGRLHLVIGTTQARPRPGVYNFGGFTDGDRAAFIAAAFSPSAIALLGMGFGKEVGRYSKPSITNYELKVAKLQVGREMLERLASRVDFPLINATLSGEEIRGFRRARPEELSELFPSSFC